MYLKYRRADALVVLQGDPSLTKLELHVKSLINTARNSNLVELPEAMLIRDNLFEHSNKGLAAIIKNFQDLYENCRDHAIRLKGGGQPSNI